MSKKTLGRRTTDSHNAASTPEEDNYHSKVGINDGTPQRRGSVPFDPPLSDGSVYPEDDTFIQFGAAGLAGVWAEENTRDSLYDALRRKETFATTGPRIRVRFFAGYDYEDGLEAKVVEQVIEVRRRDPLRALELFGRHLGMFKDHQVHEADVSLLEVLRTIERDEDAARAAE